MAAEPTSIGRPAALQTQSARKRQRLGQIARARAVQRLIASRPQMYSMLLGEEREKLGLRRQRLLRQRVPVSGVSSATLDERIARYKKKAAEARELREAIRRTEEEA